MKIKTINSHCTVVYTHVPSGVGIRSTVFSYDTPVLTVTENNDILRHWEGWSATTQRDINRAFPGVGMDKATWGKMPVVDCNF